MPRQSRSRPTARPAAPASQSRGAHTMAAPPMAHAPQVPATAQHAQSGQPGLLAQMAATAGSVAVGSTVGHGISHMLFGGRSAEPAPVAQAPVQQQAAVSCEIQAKNFTDCLKTTDVQGCTWYLEQLKACQAAAAPY